MSDVDEMLSRIDKALMIYGKICQLMEASDDDRVLLEKHAQKMRWALQDLVTQFWRETKANI